MNVVVQVLELAAGIVLVSALVLAGWSWESRLARKGVRSLYRRHRTHKGGSSLPPPPPPPAVRTRSTAF